MHAKAAQRRQFEKLRVAVDEKVDAVARHDLAARLEPWTRFVGAPADLVLQTTKLIDKLDMTLPIGPELSALLYRPRLDDRHASPFPYTVSDPECRVPATRSSATTADSILSARSGRMGAAPADQPRRTVRE